MSTSKPRPTGSNPFTPTTAAAPAADLSRRQVAAGARVAGVLLQGVEAMRRVQQKAAHVTRAACATLAGRLQEPCTVQELLSLQADLLRSEVQGSALYWQQLGAIALETQRQLLAGLGRPPPEDADAGTELPFPAHMPFFDTVNNLFSAAGTPHH